MNLATMDSARSLTTTTIGSSRSSGTPTHWLLVVYVAWFLVTPYNSPKLSFLTTIRFERILAAGAMLSILAGGCFPKIRSSVFGLSLGLISIMFLSYMQSPYSTDPRCIHWFEEHWKKVFFFICLVLGLSSLGGLARFVRGTAYVVLAYQLLTWRDFLGGGAYVYQQGVKRMCGAWSGGGIGAANSYGSLCVFALPFAVYLFQQSSTRRGKALAVGGALLSMSSILMSGVRGALVTALVYFVALESRKAIRLIIFAVLASLALLLLVPQDLQDRYGSIVGLESSKQTDDKVNEIAEESAQSRIDGLWDGMALGSMWPILGCGPEASPKARLLIRDTYGELALHNLYGQVIAELGWCGATFWAVTVAVSVVGLLRLKKSALSVLPDQRKLVMSLRQLLLHCTLILLFYGFCAHNLYGVTWLLVLGCQVVLLSTVPSGVDPNGLPRSNGSLTTAGAIR